ncbi:glycosyl transferase family 1 [Rhodopseudomonas palustris]|uniref:Glycosyl transferase family 1 n=2 Tax=Nitrobacteraceae TaxID=41294 RepID=A0A0D7F182_RHOPL|nr:glycosyl transferase family 1 [Rhodopseudomonas palustris]
MRVLHAYKVYRPDAEGGIPEVISQLAELRSLGDHCAVLTARSRGFGREFELAGVEVHAVGSFGQLLSMPIAPQFPFRLRRRARRVDVLALHAPFPLNDLGVALGIPEDAALVVHWHAEILGRKTVMKFLAPVIRHTLARADRIIVSDQSIIDGSTFLAPHAAKCLVVPYGIEPDEWSSLDQAEQQRAEVLRGQYPRLVVSMGRLVPYKGYPQLLHALQRTDAHLVIIGEGSEKAALLQLADELGVADRLTLTGFLPRPDMKVYLHAANAFVLPSVTAAEAFGLVQIEAMAAGLPVVNTWLPTAVPKIARDGVEGLTVEPNDPAALAKAINRLLDDRPFAARLAAAGRQRVAAEYSKSLFLRRIRSIYADAVADRRTPAAPKHQTKS